MHDTRGTFFQNLIGLLGGASNKRTTRTARRVGSLVRVVVLLQVLLRRRSGGIRDRVGWDAGH